MPAPVVPILAGGLVAWGLYFRVRRNLGRQKLHRRRALASLAVFAIFSVAVMVATLRDADLLLGFGCGLLPGALLGLVGLRLTRFETTEAGHFYTPNARIGVALSVLFVGRLIYRFIVLHSLARAIPPPTAMPKSPLTLFIFGLLAGYYIVYYAGVWLHSRNQK